MSRVVYAWVLDGIPTIFVSDEALDDSWAVASGFADTKVGLRRPTSLAEKINLRDLVLERTVVKIEVDDLDGTLASLFGRAKATADDLITTLDPATDPAPASTWDKHVGTERIGPAGQRRQFSCIPGFAVGLKHLGAVEAYANGGASSKIGDDPVVWNGRRCALYRVELENEGDPAEAWQTLSSARRVWWGTLRAQGTQKQGRWSFATRGPESWLSGSLGTGNFSTPIRVLPVTDLVDDGFAGPTVMRASLDVVDLIDTSDVLHTYLEVTDPDGTYNMGNQTGYAAVVSQLNTFLDQVIASTDQNPASFDSNADGNDIRFSTLDGADGITIRWLRGQTTNEGDPFINNGSLSSYTARLRLIMHEDVWKLLGYDPIQQTPARDAVEHEEQYGRFSPVGFPSGYWEGRFYPANPKAMKASDENDFGNLVRDDYSSGGFARVWPPLYRGGTFAFTGRPGQEVQLDTANEVLLSGSLARPLLEDPDDNAAPFTIGSGVGQVNRSAVLVLEGPYRRRGDQDQNSPADGYAFQLDRERREGKTVQAIRVCWRATPGGLITADADGLPRVVVQEWIDPRLMGFDYQPLDGTWGGHRDPPSGADGITARPLIVFDYAAEADKMTTVMQRVLASTGTATGWFTDGTFVTPAYGLGAPAAVLEPGANDLGGGVASDAEDSSLGLGIPASLIADPEVWAAVGSVPGIHLSRCKVIAGVSASGRELVARMLAPTGIGLGLSGGQFTPFDAWAFPTPEEAVAVITTEWYAGKAAEDPSSMLPTQSQRLWGPIDKAKVRGRIEPVGGDYFRVVDLAASDPGARERSQQIVQDVNGDHLVHPLLTLQGGSWQQDLPVRWRSAFAFWGANHTIVPIPVHAELGLDVHVGDGVLLTDPWLVNTLGNYGVSVAAGRVIGRTHNAVSEIVKLDILVADETEFRAWAPSAIVTQYDEAGPFRLLVEDDAFDDRGGGRLDVEGFIEPAYSSEGGAAELEVFSFDGSTWTRGIFGTVASIDATPGSASITLTGALTGAPWYSDEHHVVVLREWGAQVAWPQRWFAPICAKDGTHTGGQPGIKWRQL